ncbi:MAG: hypothetical protein ABJN40_13390 [Sneathiella sp.]
MSNDKQTLSQSYSLLAEQVGKLGMFIQQIGSFKGTASERSNLLIDEVRNVRRQIDHMESLCCFGELHLENEGRREKHSFVSGQSIWFDANDVDNKDDEPVTPLPNVSEYLEWCVETAGHPNPHRLYGTISFGTFYAVYSPRYELQPSKVEFFTNEELANTAAKAANSKERL